MKLSKSRPYLITFEGNDGNIALNFASPEECEEFYIRAGTIIETRNRKKQDRRNRPKSTIAPLKPPSVDQADDSKVILRNNPNNVNSITFNQNAPLPQPAPKTNIFGLGMKKDKKGKKSKESKILSKTDISGPTNFVHVQHVGWNADKGFDLNLNEADEELKTFFNKAGVSEVELKDRETREFIYDFIQTNNVLKPKDTPDVKPAPPVPTRQPVGFDSCFFFYFFNFSFFSSKRNIELVLLHHHQLVDNHLLQYQGLLQRDLHLFRLAVPLR